MRWRLLLILTSLLVRHAYAANYVSFAQQTTLNTQPAWDEWGSGNDPPGVEYRADNASATSVSGVIAMPTAVPPGTYRVWGKFKGDSPFRATLSLPGGDITKVLEDDDSNKYWTDFGTIIASTPVGSVNVVLDRSPSGAIGSSAVMGLVFTTLLSSVMTTDDYLQSWPSPTAEDTSAAVAGNYIQNSSFESGITEVSLSGNELKWFDSSDLWS